MHPGSGRALVWADIPGAIAYARQLTRAAGECRWWQWRKRSNLLVEAHHRLQEANQDLVTLMRQHAAEWPECKPKGTIEVQRAGE